MIQLNGTVIQMVIGAVRVNKKERAKDIKLCHELKVPMTDVGDWIHFCSGIFKKVNIKVFLLLKLAWRGLKVRTLISCRDQTGAPGLRCGCCLLFNVYLKLSLSCFPSKMSSLSLFIRKPEVSYINTLFNGPEFLNYYIYIIVYVEGVRCMKAITR